MKFIYAAFLIIVLPKFIWAQPETEPNNTFESANPLTEGVARTGTLNNFTSGGVTIDGDDYYMAVFGPDGTVKVNITATNTHSNNAYLFMYIYDRRKAGGAITSKYVSNNSNISSGQTINDLIPLFGRAADTLYIRLVTSATFSYSLSYTVGDTSTNDVEPNDVIDQSVPINRQEEKFGHIGYVKGGADDANDYYRTVLPFDGTLTIFVKGTNKWGSSGYLYMYGYDRRKLGGNVFSKYISNSSNIKNDSTIYDTIRVYGRAADTFYFRLISSGAFQYSVKYDIVDTTNNDSEPNDNFDDALPSSIQQEKRGHIGYVKNGSDDASDYYRTVLPYDGTLKIMVQGTNQWSGSGYMFMYGYDRRKAGGNIFSKYISGSSNIKKDSTIYDTIYVYGRAADTFYFRLISSGAFSYTFKYDIVDTSTNDVEPNDNFSEPIIISQLEVKKGHISYVKNGSDDASDYYRTVVPIDGTLKIYIQGRNRWGGNGYMYLYGYDKRKASGQVFATYVAGSSNIKPDSTIYDTITIFGVLSDTFYFRVTSSGAFSYQISYNTIVNSAFDPEPNNTFAEAIPIRQGVVQQGQIGYTLGGNTDNDDYYFSVLPTDGTLKIIVQGKNNGGANGYMFMYGYDRRKGSGQIFATYVSGSSNIKADSTIYDTIYIYGRAADTFYFRITSSKAFSYSLSYDMIHTSENDAEPNDVVDQSVPINIMEQMNGHIGYVKGGTDDASDYYRTVLPYDGTLKIMVQGRNRWSGSGYLYIYGYDRRKLGGQILSKYVSNSSNIKADSTIYDTIYIYGRAADTVYFRLTSSGAFSYQLKYDVVDTSTNDAEPNDVFAQSVNIAHLEEKKGHVGYVKNGGDDATDYYRTVLPTDGTLKIYVQGRNRWGSNGWLYMYSYDRRQGGGTIFQKYITNNSNIKADSTIYDTIYVYGRAADTTYFRITSSGAWSYSFKYEMIDTGDNDLEPNNTFAQAVPIAHQEVKKGHIGYAQNGGDDATDYYVTKLPKDGTLKVIVQGTNRNGANGYLYMYGYDRRQGGGTVFQKYISNSSSIKKDSTIYDTLYVTCRAADTFYFRFTSSGAFTYMLSYEIVDTSMNDAEPNNTFNDVIPVALGTATKGHIGYVMNGAEDNDDYYRTVIPARGSVQIIMQVTNTRGSSGYVYVYGYDKRKGAGTVLSKYVKNTSNIPANATVIDTINLNCISFDTFYYRVTSSGCFSYTFTINHIDNDPVAAITYNQAGSLHEFVNNSTNATSYTWTQNGTLLTNKIAPPLLAYKPGLYEIRLIAKNSACNFVDTAYYPLVVNGLDTITPATGGQGNVLFTAYGGGFLSTSRLRITQGATVIMDSVHYVNQHGNIFAALLDLHLAPTGVYDVELINPDTTYKKVGAFTLVAPVAKLRSQILGADRLRANTNGNYSVRVYNEGNTMAGLVEVYVLFPQYMQVTLLDSFVNLVGPQLTYVNMDTFPVFTNVTVQRGYPINGRLYSYFIAGIPAGGFKDLSFRINSGLGNQSIYAWVDGPWSGSSYTTQGEKCFEAKLKLVVDFINDGVSIIPGVDCAWSAVRAAGNALYSFYNWATGSSSGTTTTAGGIKTTYGLAKNCAGEIAAATGVGIPAGGAIEIADIGSDIAILGSNAHVNYNQVEIDCPDDPEEPKKKPVDVRNSFDPNMKSGPAGIGQPRYILGSEKLMNYTVYFENVDTATLAARDVIVLDTLDKTRFDLSSFRVLSYTIGAKKYDVPNSAFSFSEEVPYEAGGHNVRVSVNLDTATGIIRTHFKTIDTATGAYPLDPLEGFLPPNVNAPEGQGSISFVIHLKDGLADGTVINNKSSIVFDNNEAILTNTWSNTLDRNRPQSMVTSAYQLNDSTAVVKLTGSDPMSGVKNYRLYVSVNNGPWNFSRNINRRDSMAIPVMLNNRYDFYSIAVDSVGNVEQKSPVSEANVTIMPPLPIVLASISAANEGSTNRVTWLTMHDDKGDSYEVEKSLDARKFEWMATVQANGTGGDYTVLDNNAAYDRTWYRLKMINADGKYSYSKVVSAFKAKDGQFVLEAFPNPTKEKITINVSGERNGNATIQVVNMAGVVLQRTNMLQNQMEIDLGKLPKGVYYIRYTDNNRNEIIRVVKN